VTRTFTIPVLGASGALVIRALMLVGVHVNEGIRCIQNLRGGVGFTVVADPGVYSLGVHSVQRIEVIAPPFTGTGQVADHPLFITRRMEGWV